ncbi:hypothetical protein ACVDG3_18240 [Meridianimarinicoccus sp. RP-17]|uniref:hypothetical protein n=1 Tax=Meridianimarinicoccus zhengii TaxID=2056810 RepID=UPI000DACF1D8|nr:hypothetical protein [Phycocomes zhengii]
MTWWRDQLSSYGTMYAIGAAVGGIVWVFRTVFRNQLTTQYQAEQIADLRQDVRVLHGKVDTTNERITALLDRLGGHNGKQPRSDSQKYEE